MEYLTLKQAAEATDTSYATLRRDIENGVLPAYKVGRKYFITSAAAEIYGEKRRAVNSIDGYTIRQVMEILPLSYAYIIELIKNGRLPAVKRGRSYIIAKTDLQSFIEKAQL
ncbi:MAG: helix-turn-helix domain-containing protein [Firmicutes bacterium]|nr:helix-turn-helix domain-containing protein [Bacillota bacterium]